jgi:hypothetical protein
MSRPVKPVEQFEEEYIEEYEPIEVTVGDTFSVKLSHPFTFDSRQEWVTVEGVVSALPEETADDTADRVQEIALGLLFNTTDRYKAILQQRRDEEIASRNTRK